MINQLVDFVTQNLVSITRTLTVGTFTRWIFVKESGSQLCTGKVTSNDFTLRPGYALLDICPSLNRAYYSKSSSFWDQSTVYLNSTYFFISSRSQVTFFETSQQSADYPLHLKLESYHWIQRIFITREGVLSFTVNTTKIQGLTDRTYKSV